MNGQTTLLPVLPIPLRPRQQAVLDLVAASDGRGVRSDEAGAVAHSLKAGRWAHEPGDRCDYCAQDGNSILSALRKKGLVAYRRKLAAWVVVNADEMPRGMTDAIPF